MSGQPGGWRVEPLRSPWIAALVGIGVVGVSVALGSRTRLDGDIARLLPDDDAEARRTSEIVQRAMGRMVLDLALPVDAPVDSERLGAAADRLAEQLASSELVLDARARMDAGAALDAVELMRAATPRLLDPSRYPELEERLTAAALEARLVALRRRAHEPDAGFELQNARRDPAGVADLVLARLDSLTAGFEGVRLIDGRITDSDGRHLLLFVEPSFRASDTGRSAELMAHVERTIADLRAQPELAGVTVRHLSAHRSTLDNSRQIQRDVALTSSIGALAVLLIAGLALSRLRYGVLALTPALFGAAVALGLVSLFRDSMAAAVTGFGVALIGITIDYAVHVFYRLESGAGARLPLRALFMGATTTAVAFLALRASSLPALREVGTFGALGIVAAMIFATFLLPALAGGATAGRAPRVDLRRRFGPSRPRLRTALIALLVTPLVLFGLTRLELDGDVQRLSSLSPAASADEQGLIETWGAAFRTSQGIVEGRDLESALQANDALDALLADARARGELRDYSSVAAFLPALATQERRLAAWRAFWSEARVAAVRGDLAAAASAHGYSTGAFEPFFEWIEREPPALRLDDDPDGVLRALAAERVALTDERAVVTTPVFTDGWDQVAALRARVAQELPEVLVFNRESLTRDLAARVGAELWKLGGIALAAVAVIVFLWLGTIELTLLVLVPLVLSMGWALGLLGWLGVPINLANSIFAAFLFGLAVDYSIFMVAARLELFRTGRDHLAETDASVLLCATTTCVGFGVLLVAGHPVLKSIGATALTGILCALVATRVFVPTLCGLVLRRHGPGGTPRLRNMRWGFWVLRSMVGGALKHLVFARRQPDAAEDRRAASEALGRICRKVQRDGPGGRRLILGAEPDAFPRPAVIVANHESHYDSVPLLSLPPPMTILVKRWVARLPVVGAITRKAGCMVADDGAFEEVVAKARTAIESGVSVLVYPEGTRTRDGRLGRFRNGAFALARELGVDVIPVAVVNTRSVVRADTWWIGDHDARVVVLDPVSPRAFEGEDGDRRMARAVRERIHQACRAEWRATQDGPNWERPLAGMYAYLGVRVARRARRALRSDPLCRSVPDVVAGAGDVLVVEDELGLLVARLALVFPERRVLVLDSDPERLQGTRAALGERANVEYRTGGPEALGEEVFGAMVLVDALARHPSEAQEGLLAALAGRLAPDGTLLFRERCGDAPPYRSEEGWRRILRDRGLEVARSWPELASPETIALTCRPGRGSLE